MAEGEDQDSKTEQASEKKIRDAIEKGNVPVSREVATLASLGAIILAMQFFAVSDASRIAISLQNYLDSPGGWRLENTSDAMALLSESAWLGTGVLVPIVTMIIVAGLASSFLQNAPSMVIDRIQPKWSRVSLTAGWKRVFGKQGQVEFLKGAFKFFALGVIGYGLAQSSKFDVFNAMYAEPSAVPELMFRLVKALFISLALASVALAAADLFWSRFSWHQELMMSRQEVKDEHKQSDGDPLLKARLRSIARDRARRRMMTAVPRATLVIANPTHYAIALRYVREEGGAPLVVAKGTDLVALKIREIAEANNIPVVEDKPLARALYDRVEVDRFIPREFYKAVAEIILFLSTRQRAGGR